MFLTTTLKWMDRITIAVCVVLLGAIAILTVAQILARYVFFFPMVWSYELVTLLFVFISAFGAAVVLGEKEHFSVPVLADALRPRGKRILSVVINISCLIFAAIFVIKGYSLTMSMRILRTPILGLSEAIPYSILPVAGAYMGLHSIRHLLIDFGLIAEAEKKKSIEGIEIPETLK
jgi:TRAP-type C4-dicarboxylate transport system permease small subunit